MRPEIEEARDWLDHAQEDLRAAEVDLGASPPLIRDSLFHCQQAAEKALKAHLAAHNVPFRKTHNLDELGRACEKLTPELKTVIDPARKLTIFAWRFRYPSAPSTPDKTEAAEVLETARSVYDAVVSRLPE